MEKNGVTKAKSAVSITKKALKKARKQEKKAAKKAEKNERKDIILTVIPIAVQAVVDLIDRKKK